MLIELIIENDQEIVLDSTNNVFVGPEGYFKIVLEEFDGETIKSWYIEDSKGNRSPNLAERSKGKHVDALVNNNNATVSTFVTQIWKDIVREQYQKINGLGN